MNNTYVYIQPRNERPVWNQYTIVLSCKFQNQQNQACRYFSFFQNQTFLYILSPPPRGCKSTKIFVVSLNRVKKAFLTFILVYYEGKSFWAIHTSIVLFKVPSTMSITQFIVKNSQ